MSTALPREVRRIKDIIEDYKEGLFFIMTTLSTYNLRFLIVKKGNINDTKKT